MKKLKIAVLMSMIMAFNLTFAGQDNHPATDVYDGWRVATQAYTFNRFTFYEAIDKNASLGLDWIEAYPGQTLSKENPDIEFDHNMPVEYRKGVKEKLKQAGIKLVNYGVVGLPDNEDRCRKVFDFAKDMGIETIVSEPPEKAFEMIDKLCSEYEINVAIHNHPKPSHYWNPDTVLKVCQGRSGRIGACADTGHWSRSGVNPLEALKKLESRIISLHLKDLNEFGNNWAHDVPWGTGICDVKALLEELNRQDFEGVFSIEYEYNWENSVPEIRQCVEYFNEVAAKLKPSGWKNLLTLRC
ncbi:MAG: sugar phosphate isomerase/epimerase family protein [Planctomycetota bacterium]|jgi:sugar phosphate isomerase/epimerase